MAKEKIEIIDGIATKIVKHSNHYEVHIKEKNNKEEKILSTTYLVGADGASGITRLSLYKNDTLEQYLSIQEWYIDKESNPIYSCIFDKENIKTYAWTISKNNSLILGGIFKSNDSFNKIKKRITSSPVIKREACLINHVKSKKEILTGFDNSFLIGEAAGLISPSSYEGISYAIESGIILADVFNNNDKNLNRIYDRNLRKLKRKIGHKIWKARILNNKILRGIIMKSKIGSLGEKWKIKNYIL